MNFNMTAISKYLSIIFTSMHYVPYNHNAASLLSISEPSSVPLKSLVLPA